jgi:hypothetical protein
MRTTLARAALAITLAATLAACTYAPKPGAERDMTYNATAMSGEQ